MADYTSMVAELRKELVTCRRARLATASLTRGGIRIIEDALREGRSNLHVQLLVGLYNGHTEAAALRRLLGLQERFGQHFEVRIAQNGRFHWKMYLFEGRNSATAFVGSSNLTNDGLGAEGEVNLRLISTSKRGALAHISETFDRVWKNRSVPLTTGIADVFAPASSKSNATTLEIDPIIRGILRPPRREPSKNGPPKETSIMTSIEQYAGRATTRIVRDKTDWYRRGWQWMVFTRQVDRDRLFNPCAFYLVELQGKRLQISLNDVRERDELTTEDGRYLIAYQKRKNSVSRFVSPTVLARLRQAGVVKTAKDLKRDRRLSRTHREALDSILRVPRA